MDREGSSEAFWRYFLFDAEFVKKGIFPKELSVYLHQAFTCRQDSDYHAMEPVSPEKTDELIRSASAFVQTVEAYLKEVGDNEAP